jgi:hypothetical protein
MRGHSVCSLAEKRVSASWEIWIQVLGGPTPIFLLNLELDGRSCMDVVGGCLPRLSPSFHSLFGHVDSSFLATYTLTCTQTRPFPFWWVLFLLAPISQTKLLDNVYHSSMAASTRLLDNVYQSSMAASTRLLENVYQSSMAASTRLLDNVYHSSMAASTRAITQCTPQ